MRWRSLALAALVLGGATVVGGCNTVVSGQPSNGSPGSGGSSSTSGSGKGSLASVDPCTLLTRQAAQQLAVTEGPELPKVKDADLARVCSWDTDKAHFQVGLDFRRRYDDSGIAGIGKMQRLTVGGLTGVLGDNIGGGRGCLARFDAGEGQVVDGTASAHLTGALDPCALLRQVMELAMAELPK